LQTDRWLFGSTLALCLVGAVMVFSASAVIAREQHGSAYTFIVRQAIWLVLGLAGMFAMMNVDYRKLRQPAVIFTGLFAVFALLVGVFFLDKSHATHRWIRLGPASIQPSEFAKLAVIAYLAWFLEMRRKWGAPQSEARPGRKAAAPAQRKRRAVDSVNDFRNTLLPALGPVVILVGLVVIEPDLGTAIEIFVIALAMLFVAVL
jgi:cell division protein FtsW